MKKFVAIIPARKNSRRLKNKNLTKIGKKKLIEYTFATAVKSKKLDDIILTTDDLRIINLAKKYGIKAPFIRPKSISGPHATTESVLIHALKFYLNKYNFLPDNLVLLQPTSPFRTAKDIDMSIKKYERLKSSSLVSVSKPLNSLNGIYISLNKDFLKKNLKKFESKGFFLNGSIYISNIKKFLKTKKLFGNKSNYFLTSKENSIDINDEIDLNLAKTLIKKLK